MIKEKKNSPQPPTKVKNGGDRPKSQTFLRENREGVRSISLSRGLLGQPGGGKIYCADNVNINAECMLVASSDITIGKNGTLAYRTIPYNECESEFSI